MALRVSWRHALLVVLVVVIGIGSYLASAAVASRPAVINPRGHSRTKSALQPLANGSSADLHSNAGNGASYRSLGGLLGLDAALAEMLDGHFVAHTAVMDEASVNCGPAGSPLAVGSDVVCGVQSSSGSTTAILSILAPNARRFGFVAIGAAITNKLTGAAARAWHACERTEFDSCAPTTAVLDYRATPSGGGTPPPLGSPGVMPCVGSPTMKPTNIEISCADGNWFVEHVAWSSWGPRRAVGHGIERLNDCTPYCAIGKFHSASVTLILSTPVATHYGLVFSELTLNGSSVLPGAASATSRISMPMTPGI